MDGREHRIRERAHRIWEEEGRPHGREDSHWEMASEQIAIEDNQRLATKPNPLAEADDSRAPGAEPVEPLLAVENQGEFPTLTDQGEETTAPRRRVTPSDGSADTGAKRRRSAAPPAARRRRKEA